MTTDHMCLAAIEPCGCVAAVVVLGYGHDGDGFKEMGKNADRGCRIEHQTVAEWRAKYPSWHCSDHPNGPPWWKSNGGKGKRPAEYTPNLEMGL